MYFCILIEIALAVILDNRGEFKVDLENEKRILNDEADALKKAFEDLEFAVLYLYSLSSESIATLLQAICEADRSQLSMIALVFLSKGKTAELYDVDGVMVPYKDVFDPFKKCSVDLPVIFFFDSASDHTKKEKSFATDDKPNENDSTFDEVYVQNESNLTEADTQNENDFNLPQNICPKNSLVLAARHSLASSPVVKEFTEKLSHTSVQECFKTICANNNSTTVKTIWHETKVGDKFFIVKSINDR